MKNQLQSSNRKFWLLLGIIVFLALKSSAQMLGTYPNATLVTGGDTIITPSVAPTNTTRINASTDTNFKGTFAVSPTTGAIRVTNANPAGTYTVTVRAFNAAGNMTSQTFILTVNNAASCGGAIQFTSAPDLNTGGNNLAIGDFNNDGKQDLAVTFSSAGVDRVLIRLGDGAGNFTNAPDVSVGSFPSGVIVGDFNNDGNQDFAAVNQFSNSVSVRLGDGAGNFTNAPDVSVPNRPINIAIGDFNVDGKQDFATTDFNSSGVSVRLGDGAGNFTAVPDFFLGNGITNLAVGDFNGDGKPDLAVSDAFSPNVFVRLGDGAGNFSGGSNVGVASNPSAVAVGDFNNDGKQDFVSSANTTNNTISVRLGDGTGGFGGTTNYSLAGVGLYIAVGDFNNDGKQDFAVPNFQPGNGNFVSVGVGDAAGNFGITNIPVSATGGISVGDFNGDGKQDLATGGGSTRLGGCVVTAASVSIGGKVVNYEGRGVFGARIVLTSASGNQIFAMTNPFGFYRFEDVPAGETYIIGATHKRYIFAPQVISLTENLDNLDFTAQSELKMFLPDKFFGIQ